MPLYTHIHSQYIHAHIHTHNTYMHTHNTCTQYIGAHTSMATNASEPTIDFS